MFQMYKIRLIEKHDRVQCTSAVSNGLIQLEHNGTNTNSVSVDIAITEPTYTHTS